MNRGRRYHSSDGHHCGNGLRRLGLRCHSPHPKSSVAGVRHGVHFHVARERTAEVVAYTFRRFLDPKFVSGRKGAYKMIASIDVVDRYTVAFHLRDAAGSFPVNLVMRIVPTGTGIEAARRPIGRGPEQYAECVPDDPYPHNAFEGHSQSDTINTGLI